MRTWIMVAGLIMGFYAPTVAAEGYVIVRLSRAGFVGQSDFIGAESKPFLYAVDCGYAVCKQRPGPDPGRRRGKRSRLP